MPNLLPLVLISLACLIALAALASHNNHTW